MKTYCKNCGKDISIKVEFGGAELWGCDGDFVCDKKCKEEYQQKVDRDISRICSMTDEQFTNYMLGH